MFCFNKLKYIKLTKFKFFVVFIDNNSELTTFLGKLDLPELHCVYLGTSMIRENIYKQVNMNVTD